GLASAPWSSAAARSATRSSSMRSWAAGDTAAAASPRRVRQKSGGANGNAGGKRAPAAEAEADSTPSPPPGLLAAVLAFPKTQPYATNIIIATGKTAAADLMTQVVVEGKSWEQVDWKRNMVFVVFGAGYLGAFQWLIQVNVFSKLFPNMATFANASWAAKLKDRPGQLNVLYQCFLDAFIHLPLVYLPTFYVVKEMVMGGKANPAEWVQDGVRKYLANWLVDVPQLIYVWAPTDLVCFSVPLYLRMPLRHVVSFAWTAYLSFLRG
ncbi:MAG: Mpv17/PMP22 family protein, partial [Pseudomonadota bacterium]